MRNFVNLFLTDFMRFFRLTEMRYTSAHILAPAPAPAPAILFCKNLKQKTKFVEKKMLNQKT